MNTKKMTTEQLQEQVEKFNHLSITKQQNEAEIAWFTACKSELARRWGIKL